ncbi:FAD-dependent oxidoreductase [Streptomyces litchfieldiae]|uniref:FAD-dependent oxidoreductase n=1 Tax=Streptomyces litchfieldiae TaxID=3075543 RepID=A0ABU2MS32_9ACTN|nr:FAD-dependent oxidoreductase [Streptomyces sp. DSM 44938]MDT0344432.1 FAD-dependent oxidoreductase [Streptomyces sp. DSM 44938]
MVLTWFAPRDLARYTPDRFPAFIRDTDGVHLFGVPVLDGMSVKTGFADDFGDLAGPEAYTWDFDEARLRPVSEAVRNLLPGLHPDPIRYAVYQEGYTADRTAVVDRVPGQERAIVLAGFSGHGFKMAPCSARSPPTWCWSGAPASTSGRWPPAGSPPPRSQGDSAGPAGRAALSASRSDSAASGGLPALTATDSGVTA